MNTIFHFVLSCSLAAVLLAGCCHQPGPAVDKTRDDIELTTVPFFPQEESSSAACALAALLVSADVVAIPELLSPALFAPSHRGKLQLEIIASVRSVDRIPYQLQPQPEAITAELRAGRAVLILHNLGLKWWPIYHYAVVIGQQQDGSFILRSGNTERLIMARKRFVHLWENAGSWALVALKPTEMPVDRNLSHYLDAVARMEAIGKVQLAEQSYRTILSAHPDNELALFGLANTMFTQGRYLSAAKFYSYLLHRTPHQAAAANNLAESLSALRCHRLGLELLDTYLCPDCSPPLEKSLLQYTRDQIQIRAKAKHSDPPACQQLEHLLDYRK